MARKRIIVLILTMIMLISIPVSAKEITNTPSLGYEFNSDGESVAAPVGYIQSKIINSSQMKLDKPLSSPSDMIYKNGLLFILDSGNSRVVVLDENFAVVQIRSDFRHENEKMTFIGAQGMDIAENGTIYIADTEMNRVLVFDKNNEYIREITRPDEALQDTGSPFRATKVKIDRQGCLLVIAESINAGAFRFDKNGEFLGFFGRNTVIKTADVLLNYMYKKILTRSQISKLQNYTPRIILNMDIDSDGFVYLVDSSNTTTGASAVRKLNYKGSNIFETSGIINTFGDTEWDREEVERSYTNFGDVDLSDDGFINLLDKGRNKVFQYTQEGQLTAVFGGKGTQYGSFTAPSAIESVGDKIYILDSTENSISVFTPTEYERALKSAFSLLDTDDTEKSVTAWNNVLELNSNSLYPYYGLGLVYENSGDYEAAMEMFKVSNSKEEYSNVFREYRQIYMRSNAWWLLLAVGALIISAVFAVRALKKRKKSSETAAFSSIETRNFLPIYTLLHPVDGFEQFKWREGLTSWRISSGIIIVWFLINVAEFFNTGFIFNNNNPADYNIIVTLIGSVFIYLLFVISNWGISSLTYGSGKLKEIATVTAYSLIPYIAAKALSIILSQFLVTEEAVFISIITVVGILWSFILLFGGLYAIHQYSVLKTVLNLVLTLVGMAVATLIILLFFTLMQQFVFFIKTVAAEWQLR